MSFIRPSKVLHRSYDMLVFACLGLLYSVLCLCVAEFYSNEFISGVESGIYWLQIYQAGLAGLGWLVVLGLSAFWMSLAVARITMNRPVELKYFWLLTALLPLMWLTTLSMIGPAIGAALLGDNIAHLDTLQVANHKYYLADRKKLFVGTTECWGDPPGECSIGNVPESHEFALFECDRLGILCNRVYLSNLRSERPLDGWLDFNSESQEVVIWLGDVTLYSYKVAE